MIRSITAESSCVRMTDGGRRVGVVRFCKREQGRSQLGRDGLGTARPGIVELPSSGRKSRSGTRRREIWASRSHVPHKIRSRVRVRRGFEAIASSGRSVGGPQSSLSPCSPLPAYTRQSSRILLSCHRLFGHSDAPQLSDVRRLRRPRCFPPQLVSVCFRRVGLSGYEHPVVHQLS